MVSIGEEGTTFLCDMLLPYFTSPCLIRSMYQRLVELSKNGPPPVSDNGDDDKFPVEACAQVTESGTWLPWEYSTKNVKRIR